MQFEEIKSIIKEECKEYGIKFKHGKGKTVIFKQSIKSNGYFYGVNEADDEDDVSILAIATNANSLDTLVHEYCHMQQYLEQCKEWTDLDGNGQIWEWIGGEDDFTEEELDNSVLVSYNVELDCERRSVAQHRKWKTGINLTEYIQKANAYSMFYFFMRDHRVWYKPGREPYSIKAVWSQMPKTFTFNRDKCYNKVQHLFKRCI